MATVGVSTERGAVRAVLLGGPGGGPPGRVVAQREETPPSEDPPGFAAAVEAVLVGLRADIARESPDVTIDSVAVAYRDEAERAAIEERLAGGPWSAATSVPVSAAHLAAVGAVPNLDRYRTLLVYDVVPGRHTFTVVDPGRGQVLGSDWIESDGEAPVAIGQGIRNAWSLLDAAGVEPEGVVLIGSAASEPGVEQVLRVWFDAPVVAGANAALSTAVGAGLLAGNVADEPVPPTEPVAIVTVAEPGPAVAPVAGSRRPGRIAVAALAAGLAVMAGLGLAFFDARSNDDSSAGTTALSVAPPPDTSGGATTTMSSSSGSTPPGSAGFGRTPPGGVPVAGTAGGVPVAGTAGVPDPPESPWTPPSPWLSDRAPLLAPPPAAAVDYPGQGSTADRPHPGAAPVDDDVASGGSRSAATSSCSRSSAAVPTTSLVPATSASSPAVPPPVVSSTGSPSTTEETSAADGSCPWRTAAPTATPGSDAPGATTVPPSPATAIPPRRIPLPLPLPIVPAPAGDPAG